ncbi:MAG: zinc ribbon domain-containing protein [Candidatus Thorarchaeota archaeon]|nr:zinc ribbon domain-containing protein [Candidatus Thorarchaeota archaeon]
MGWLFVTSLSWVFLIPIFFLFWSFFASVLKNIRGRSEVREEIQKGDVESIQDIADRTGMREEQVRRHIVHDKRGGTADIWFDSSTGQRAFTPVPERTSADLYGCKYCGFALRSEDRFCPYCGAPIMAEN